MSKRYAFDGAAPQARREKAGLTKAEVARRAGISPEHLGRIEKGVYTPSVVTFANIAAALRREPEFLLVLCVRVIDPSDT